jgi:hypothetical protein
VRGYRWAAGAVLGVMLAGCGGTGGAPPTAPDTSTSSTSPSVSASAEASPLDADTGAPTGDTASPTWDQRTAGAAGEAAAAATAMFVRKDLPAAGWAARLAPLLTDRAAADYLGDDPAGPSTDPGNVPGTAVTGTAVASPGPSPYLAAVTVPTDAGRYVVLLSRTDGSAGWLVERFVLPEQTGGP